MNASTSNSSDTLTIDHILQAMGRMPPRPPEIRTSKTLVQQFRFPGAGMPPRMARAWRKRPENFRPLPYAIKDTVRNVIYMHPDTLAAIQKAL